MARQPKRPVKEGFTFTVPGIEVSTETAEKLTELKTKFDNTQTYWMSLHEKMRLDVKFFNGIQYDEQWARAARARGSKVQIQLNMLPQYVQQVESQIRQMDMSISVHATDEKGSDETAEIFSGMFRHIENISNAKNAYISAYGKNGALVPGIGYIKWNKRYVSERSDEQELIIEEVKDPFKILPDYFAKKSDFSDAEYWFEYDIMSKEDFEKQFPDAQVTSFQSWKNIQLKNWITDTTVQVVKYWYKETTPDLVVKLPDGRVGLKSEFEEELVDTIDENGQPVASSLFMEVLRKTEVVSVKWILTNGVEILDQGEWDDSEYPFVAFVGTDTYYDGQRSIYGLIHNAHDCQKMINYMASKFVQKIGATNKSPWIAPIDAIPENLRKDWNQSNVDEKAVLYFQEYVNGRQVTAPYRADTQEPAVQALLSGTQLFGESLKRTLGVPDAMLGIVPDQSVQQSGVALNNLTEQGAQSNHHFSDNTVLSMKRVAELGIRLMPKIYDTERAVRIINPDGSDELIKINQIFQRKGKQVNYKLGSGQYGVTIDTGPSLASRKAGQQKFLLGLLQSQPEIAPMMLDKVIELSDSDPNGILTKRIQMWYANNPQLAWITANEQNGQQVDPQTRVMLQQMQAQHAQLLNAYQKAEMQIQQLTQEKQAKTLDNAAKERQIILKGNFDLQMKRIDLQEALVKAQEESIKFHIKEQLAHINNQQRIHLEYLKHHDAKYGTQDQNEYDMLQKRIDS